MSCSLWRWTEACKDHADECVGDCDLCSFDPEEKTLTLSDMTVKLDDETIYWKWFRIGDWRGSTYQEVIKAWEREKGYRHRRHDDK